jgi:hypothetical protein
MAIIKWVNDYFSSSLVKNKDTTPAIDLHTEKFTHICVAVGVSTNGTNNPSFGGTCSAFQLELQVRPYPGAQWHSIALGTSGAGIPQLVRTRPVSGAGNGYGTFDQHPWIFHFHAAPFSETGVAADITASFPIFGYQQARFRVVSASAGTSGSITAGLSLTPGLVRYPYGA